MRDARCSSVPAPWDDYSRKPAACPDGWNCPDYFIDLTQIAPQIGTYYFGTFAFNLYCTNPETVDETLTYSWMLEDGQDHQSAPSVFSFVCQHYLNASLSTDDGGAQMMEGGLRSLGQTPSLPGELGAVLSFVR